jgi:RNA methyltransferase, TrmH family
MVLAGDRIGVPLLITSPQNRRVKDAIRLDKRGDRDSRRVTRVEGVREVAKALAAGVIPEEAFVCPEIARQPALQPALERLAELDASRQTRLYEVTAEVFARLAVREESGGAVLVVPYLDRDLGSLTPGDVPFFCVVEGVEKPGNLGAILRSADGAGVDAVIVTASSTDLHNPNVIRASLGAFFTVQLCDAPAPELLGFLRTHDIRIVAADPLGESAYTEADLRGPVAVVMGSEAHGLSDFWRREADVRVHIPMRGSVDSLNLATATALLLYEVVRQRGV